MTRVDLDAVLKLQREHTELEQRIDRLVEYAKARQEGHIAYFVKGDDVIDFVASIINEMADKIKKLEDGTNIHED